MIEKLHNIPEKSDAFLRQYRLQYPEASGLTDDQIWARIDVVINGMVKRQSVPIKTMGQRIRVLPR